MNLVLKDEYDSQFDSPKILTRLMAVILMSELMDTHSFASLLRKKDPTHNYVRDGALSLTWEPKY